MIAELCRDLIGDEATRATHCPGDALQKSVLRPRFDDKKGQAGNDIVTMRMAHLAQRFRQVQGIGIEHGYARVAAKLLAKVGNEFLVELEENEARLGIHALDDLPGVTSLAGAELDNDARLGKIKASRGLPGQKW